MNRPTTFRVTRLTLPRLLALAATLGLALGAPAAASAFGDVYLKIEGIGSSVPGGGCLDCLGPVIDASGTATCSVCLAGQPASGDFVLNLGVTTFPPSPCKVKGVTGTVQIAWSDGTTSTATVSGKFHDSKALALTGAFAATDPAYANDATALVLNNFPPDPCVATTNDITGALAISTS